MCRVFDVCNRSWRPGVREPRSGRAYESRRITAALRREGFVVCRKRVRRIMRELDLRARQYRSKNVTTRSGHRGDDIPDRVRRDFHPRKPDQLWEPDATWLPT